jgi:hypothetical protein
VDVHLLSKDDIVTNLDGTKSIFINKKTNINCKIPILPIVEQIFDKDDPLVSVEFEQTLPVSSNQRTNAYLK